MGFQFLPYLIAFFSLAYAEDADKFWAPMDNFTSTKLYEALKNPPIINLDFEKKIRIVGVPGKAHDWLDPKIVKWGAGNFLVSCRIEVFQHGTKAKLDESMCTIKIGKVEKLFKGANAATIYKRLLNPQKILQRRRYPQWKIANL